MALHMVYDPDVICSNDGCTNNVIMGTYYCFEHTPSSITTTTTYDSTAYIDALN